YDSMSNVAELAAEGREWGLPLMAEMLPGGFDPSIENSIENLTLVARTGCEYGASIIKTSFTGTAEEYANVIRASYQPVVVLGGEKVSDLAGLFGAIETAMEAGAKGCAIGRNVWKHKDPEAVTRALVDIIHNGKKASEIPAL
ncbi:MAG: aldolase, partial [Clostridiales bacterium]|nr:aldolase [Clostridiales bacterium]